MADLHPADEYESRPADFVHVIPGGTLIYIGIADRAAFDLIAHPCSDIDNENGHVLVKSFDDAGGVMIVIQHWLKSLTTDAFLARRSKQRAALSALTSAGTAPAEHSGLRSTRAAATREVAGASPAPRSNPSTEA